MTENTHPIPRLESAATDTLRVGDVIRDLGMRLLIDRSLECDFPSVEPGRRLYFTDALILNWSQVCERAAADPTISGFIASQCRRNRRWMIQGGTENRWWREIPELRAD
ncbi:hypothetical protein [Nocardia veterana]|uniref:Uncharacterized protein n=1 Tax=Nocardia veterana TaxID=132249 RepID=A0A7X6M3U2_9NOCA|nr:hypothetical protein [Nocardia veterana]NKY89874.1 hypothetical protein [Nocardia veterana]